jgi:predicted nucleic acid-binding protein
MTVPYFLDTNILIYAASKDDARKRKIASSLIEAGEFGVSAQVLGEFYNTATLKMRETMTPDQAEAWIDLLSLQNCVALNAELVKSGIRTARRYGISYWDGAIVAAAEVLGAPILYTEDLNHGQVYGAVTAINPFHEPRQEAGFHEPPARPLEGAP